MIENWISHLYDILQIYIYIYIYIYIPDIPKIFTGKLPASLPTFAVINQFGNVKPEFKYANWHPCLISNFAETNSDLIISEKKENIPNNFLKYPVHDFWIGVNDKIHDIPSTSKFGPINIFTKPGQQADIFLSYKSFFWPTRSKLFEINNFVLLSVNKWKLIYGENNKKIIQLWIKE